MDKDIKRAPIIIFAYKRVGHLQKVLDALEKNQEAQESELFIFVDGWKNEEEKRAVEEVHNFLDQYVLEKKFKNIFMHKEERNKGLAKVEENKKRIKLEKLPLSKKIDKETYNFWSGKGTMLQEIRKFY